ncbi:PilZ domain-containing protein [Sphingomonas montana]|uniref:PilZ domain-containing protein n=1 Tax=Sphingomonas montana TaxID=1843236 RepID=UPI0009701CB4|nr:PilZ domain-containing protein [Sphingomonas montana]
MDDRFAIARNQDEVAGAQERIHAKDGMFLEATAVRLGEPVAMLRVRNLSAGGMMAETGQSFAVGERLTMELRSIGIVDARVAWIRPGQVGIAFDRPVDPRHVRRIHATSMDTASEPADASTAENDPPTTAGT